MITVVILLVQAALAIASTRLVGLINSLAVGVEVTIVIVLVIALLVAVAVTGDGSVSNLGSRGVAADSANYFAFGGGLMAVMIVGLATLVGFESAANMAEEAKDPHRTVPRAIVGSVAAAGVLGMLFLIGLTVAIDDISKVTASGSPVATIMRDQLGAPTERILLVVIAIAFFGGGLVSMTSCARIVFAMSRDRRFPAHRLMKQVSPRIPAARRHRVEQHGIVLGRHQPGPPRVRVDRRALRRVQVGGDDADAAVLQERTRHQVQCARAGPHVH